MTNITFNILSVYDKYRVCYDIYHKQREVSMILKVLYEDTEGTTRWVQRSSLKDAKVQIVTDDLGNNYIRVSVKGHTIHSEEFNDCDKAKLRCMEIFSLMYFGILNNADECIHINDLLKV